MTYLASAAGALIVDRNAWHGRADQAWGDTRVWNSGTSFEADRNYWKTTVAHDDPNVYTNRYNTGYADGNAAGVAANQPPASPYVATAQFVANAFQSAANSLANAQAIGLQSQVNSTAGAWSASTFTVSKSGFYVCMGTIGRPSNDNDRGNQQAHLFWWSNRTGNGQDFYVSWQDLLVGQQHAAYQEMNLLAGDTVQLRMWIVTIDNGVGMINPYGIRIMFVPTAAYPK